MTKQATKEHLKLIIRLAGSGDTVALAEEIRVCLLSDFDDGLSKIITEKWISRLRNTAEIRKLRTTLITPSLSSALDSSQLVKVKHHFDVCEFFQEVFSEIDSQSISLQCREAHPDNVACSVAQFIVAANLSFQRATLTSLAKTVKDRIPTSAMTAYERRFRDVLDAGNIVLNSEVALRGSDRARVPTIAEVSSLIRLALLYDEIRQAFDMYSYRGAEVRIRRRSLVVGRTDPKRELLAAIGYERSGSHDQTRQLILAPFAAAVLRACDDLPAGPSFFEFLVAAAAGPCREAARSFGRAFAKDLEMEISDFFDVSTEVALRSNTFAILELIRCWASLYTLALIAEKWSELRAKAVAQEGAEDGSKSQHINETDLLPNVKRRWLIRILAREAGFGVQRAQCLIEEFTSRPGTARADLFYRPLLLLTNDTLALPTPYIRGSRFERNLFVKIATESKLDQKRKGYVPLIELVNGFKSANFQAASNVKVRVDGRDLTDIDLVSFKDGVLFVCQCKILIEPDSLYDMWKSERKLAAAGDQLATCLLHLDEVRSTIFERLRLKGRREVRVAPFILTSSRQFTGLRFAGYPVVDIHYLNFLLAGARNSVISTGDGAIGIGPGRSHIRGEKPTASELEDLIRSTIHAGPERSIRNSYVMRKIGQRRIHLPVMALTGESETGYVIGSAEDEPQS